MNAADFFALGNTYEQKMMFDKAAESYREAIRIDPNHSAAYARLGFALYNIRQLDKAETYLKHSLQLNSDYDEAYCCLGMIYRETARFDEAVEYFKMALKINPESSWLYTNLGVTLQHKGNAEEGRFFLNKAIEKNPNIKSGHFSLDSLLINDEECIAEKNNFPPFRDNKILIVVSAFNRKKITGLSLAQTKRYKTANCCLSVYDDHSTDYDNAFLSEYADEVIQLPEKMGIDRLRWVQFKNFLETDFDYLYLTDNDVIHDPDFIATLNYLYEKGRRRFPVSLFNNIFMLQPRLILYCRNGLFIKTSAPGASMFFDRNMVESIMSVSDKIGNQLDYLPWDNRAVACLRLPWITPEMSYLEHFGAGGLNSDNYERERAVNPTDYLRQRRAGILKYLVQGDCDEPEL